jgi:hypothetical protein
MVATPFQLLAPLLLGLVTLAMLGAAAFLLLRSGRTPAVANRRGDAVVYEPMSRDGARRRRRTLVGIALAMLIWVGFGRNLVSLLRPSGDAPQDAFGAVTRRVTGPSGAELAVEESGPLDAPE